MHRAAQSHRSRGHGRLFFLTLAASVLWEAPQSVLGLMVWGVFSARGRVVRRYAYAGRLMIGVRATAAVSLGHFVFFFAHDAPETPLASDNERHEFGHARQSRMLGPLYLFVVGVPSALRFLYSAYHRRRHGTGWPGYFDGFPENWADRLGGVKRD